MIRGVVTAGREPIIPIELHGPGGQVRVVEAVFDSGYTGWLTLPPDVVAALGLTWRESGAATLADGTDVSFDVYNATVLWDGQEIVIPVDEIDAEPLAGMTLTYGYEICIANVDGGPVILKHLSTS